MSDLAMELRQQGNGRALVTGATGSVGSHLVRRLVDAGVEVHILCRESSDFWRLSDRTSGIVRHIAPVEDPVAVQKAVQAARADYIFHLAASTVVAGSSSGATDLIQVNLNGTVNLIHALEPYPFRGLVTTGDSFEYSPGPAPHAEDEACMPTAMHGISKLASTLYARSEAITKKLPIVTLRLFSTYGPYDHPKRLVPQIVRRALAAEPLPLSRPGIARDWIYIDDVIDLYLLAALNAHQHRGEVYNAGSGVSIPLGDVVAKILELTGSTSEAQWGTFGAPEHDAFPWTADPTRTFRAFQWRPQVSFEAGLRSTIASIAGVANQHAS